VIQIIILFIFFIKHDNCSHQLKYEKIFFFFISIGYKSVRNFSLKNTQIEYLAKIISDLLNQDYKRQCTYNMSSPTFLYNSSCHSFCKRSTSSGWFYWYWLWNNLRSMYISWWWWCTLSNLFSMFLPPILYINSRKFIKSKEKKMFAFNTAEMQNNYCDRTEICVC
jgi:hypothetical protein